MKRLIVVAVIMLSFYSVAMTTGQSGQGTLGIIVQDSDAGIVVDTVLPGMPAEIAGIQVGDIIRTVDGQNLEGTKDLIALLRNYAPGDKATLGILRDGETIEIAVVLAERVGVDIPDNTNQPPISFQESRLQLGVAYRTLTPEIARREGLAVGEGAWIQRVVPHSPADDAGLQMGDIIIAVDGDKVDYERTLSDRLYAYEAEDRVILTVIRGNEPIEIGVVLGADHPDKQRRIIPNVPNVEVPNIDLPPFPNQDRQPFIQYTFRCRFTGANVEFIVSIPMPIVSNFYPFPIGENFNCERIER